ncbi:MAG: hypothetical protein ACYS9H_08630, partial [Planctomycetota bacterium]
MSLVTTKAIDASGNGNDGIVSNALPAEDRFGNTQGAYLFKGLNEYIDMGDIEIVTGNTMSVSAWFKTTGTLQYATAIVSKL